MRRSTWVIAMVLGCALAQPAAAQMAGALGKPLPVSDLEVGTVTVRVVDGDLTKPMVGINVQLSGAGDRTARTDAQGRATFPRLKPGQRYTATITTETGQNDDTKTTRSEGFAVPASGGLRILLSPSPLAGAGGPAAPMAAGMPNPRQMSGTPRGERNDPPGRLTVRVIQGEMRNNVADHPVHLVGYSAGGAVFKVTKNTDAGGRAVFDDLVPGNIAYYATTALPRSTSAGEVYDRVRSGIIIMPRQAGVRLLLAGLAQGSPARAVDDLDLIAVPERVPAGSVLVRLDGDVTVARELELMRISGPSSEPEVVAKAPVGPSSPRDVLGSAGDAVQQSSLPDGTLEVMVTRQSSGSMQPIPRIRVEVIPADEGAASGADADGAAPVAAKEAVTNAQGGARFEALTPGRQYRLVATVYDRRIESAPFTVPQSGGLRVPVTAMWRQMSLAETWFENVPEDAGVTYFARAGDYKTVAFQMVPDRGATVKMLLASEPDMLRPFSFHLESSPDDVYMGFRGQFRLHNYTYEPWYPGPDGLVIPLPKGFIGAQVGEDAMDRVTVDPDVGLIWRRAIPPGGAEFLAGFSLPIADGQTKFDMPLPLGSLNSMLAMRYTPGMKLIKHTPTGTQDMTADGNGRKVQDREGRDFFLLSGITIMNKPRAQSMVFSVTGLPQKPAWQGYVEAAVGAVVFLLLVWAAFGVFTQRRSEVMATAAGERRGDRDAGRHRKLKKRRESLLDELASLDSKKGDMDAEEYEKRRQKLIKRLESVYAEIAQSDSAGAANSAA